MQQHNIKIIISGGGTGGHVFPAIAIANALKNKCENIDILFVGAIGRMEMDKVPAAGYPIEGLPVSGFQRRFTFKNLAFPFKLYASLQKAKKILKKFNPDVVVGVGGYASGPIVKAASKRNIPTVLQEQNSYPGITNKLLARKASAICVAYEGLEKYFPKEKIHLTGNPVRQDIVNLTGKKEKGIEHFGVNANKPVILAVGGSLGARTINESLLNKINLFVENNIQLVWQTGKNFHISQQEKEVLSNKGIKIYEFISKMDLAYAIADVVISRAGAISISELSVVKKPSVLVPSPNVAEDHQTHNAMSLVKHDAAIMIRDNEANEKLVNTAIEISLDKEKREQLVRNISNMGKIDAADAIATIILNLTK